MTPAEVQREVNGQRLAMQFNCSPFIGLMGQSAISPLGVLLGHQQASTFNYRKFSKAGDYRKGELRRIVMVIAENGYIRRVK